ncbi:CBS domain-containing protein [Ornithinibacillus sp. BX22]|uniref:CBS domain-containing protein n=2 Tax=Ornithinibacillus TaxID=484508 RepID=A0A923RHE4_9BACI|nr:MULTISPECIES: CBS domain-containing protein [Ornithinibacillus]MBC5636083.1 CBS domain-containing protein [Ornithinibacillus hominis]MBS3679909.1 CBS domain-containing protein [Ornithinibacillus massiliensis]
MLIKEFMISDVISVKEDTTLKALLKLLVSHKIGGVPVVNEDNVLVGVISDGDVIRYLKPNSRTIFDMFAVVMVNEQEKLTDKLQYALTKPVSSMMKTKDIKTLRPNHDIDDALRMFSHYRFKKIPVIDSAKKVVGVVSRGDLLRHITNELIQG